MGKKLFIGNLAFTTDDVALHGAFAIHGTVESAKVVTDRDTGRSRGFGFVEMANEADASNAVSALNASNLDGRTINVSEAKPQASRENRRSDFGNRGGRY